MTPLWIVGKNVPGHRAAWEIIGVFDDESFADAACLTEQHFYGPATLNLAQHKDNVTWPNCKRPRVAHTICDTCGVPATMKRTAESAGITHFCDEHAVGEGSLRSVWGVTWEPMK